MKPPPDPRRWAMGWLRGVARSVAEGLTPPATLKAAVRLARKAGLTNEEIQDIIQGESPPEQPPH